MLDRLFILLYFTYRCFLSDDFSNWCPFASFPRNAGSPFWWYCCLHGPCGPCMLQLGPSSTTALGETPWKEYWAWAIPAPVSLHPGVGTQRPQPSQVEAVDMTKSSSKGNGLSMPSFDAPNRKDTRSLLKLPLPSDLNSISSMSTYSGSGTNSINSQALARPSGEMQGPRIQDSKRKISKVRPI